MKQTTNTEIGAPLPANKPKRLDHMQKILGLYSSGVKKSKPLVRFEDWAYKKYSQKGQPIILCGVLKVMQVYGKQKMSGYLEASENKNGDSVVYFVTKDHTGWLEANQDSVPSLSIPDELLKVYQETRFPLPKKDQEMFLNNLDFDWSSGIEVTLVGINRMSGLMTSGEKVEFVSPILDYVVKSSE
jgi:hypothetical protein